MDGSGTSLLNRRVLVLVGGYGAGKTQLLLIELEWFNTSFQY
ncbi:hypothetical protein [Desulfosporosinus burensis]